MRDNALTLFKTLDKQGEYVKSNYFTEENNNKNGIFKDWLTKSSVDYELSNTKKTQKMDEFMLFHTPTNEVHIEPKTLFESDFDFSFIYSYIPTISLNDIQDTLIYYSPDKIYTLMININMTDTPYFLFDNLQYLWIEFDNVNIKLFHWGTTMISDLISKYLF
eukprot:UN24297